MDLNLNFAELDDAALAEYATTVLDAFNAIVGLDAPTVAQVDEASALADHLDAIKAEQTARETVASEAAERFAALRTRFSTDTDEAEAEVEAEDEEEEEPEAEAEEEQPEAEEKPSVAARSKGVTILARKVSRPAKPALARKPISITAAADVPQFATGSTLDGMDAVTQAVLNRMKGFGTPNGDGETENLQHYGVASFHLDFPEELTIDRHSDDMEVLSRAANEARLPGNSLVAANGWCAPSETIYDLCTTETTDGILSVPEVNVKRGGIKTTTGIDFSTIYSNVGFSQTEAQAIAGTTKTCYEVPCPTFTDTRLDAVGICIKAPILLNSAYPEMVKRIISGSLIAHQHKVNAAVIGKMVTAAGTANAVNDFGGTAQNTLANLELLADRLRQKYKMGLNQTMEVVLPYWVRTAMRSDLSLRTGTSVEAVTDAILDAHFRTRKLNVQFVYDWQELTDYATTEGYPATYQALIYPAGTFVKGTSDVINLNAVYDAASLATNIYTALFYEQGLLVAKVCAEAMLVTLAVCNSGKTGVANVATCGAGA